MLKRNFYSDPRHIGHFKGYRKKYSTNEDYQREEVWTLNEKQYFIDTIIQKYPIPQVFIRVLPDGFFEIVDGQQRLTTIWDFLGDTFPLSLKYSDPEFDGRKFSSFTDLEKIDFEGTRVPVIWLEHYNDEDIRSLFRRLQSGKQLTTGEKLNAFPGKITLIMRELANHQLFDKVNFSTKRYKPLQLVAQTFLLVNNGITDIGASKLYDFFNSNKNADHNTGFYKTSKKILNYMNKVITDDKLIEMSKPSWFINYFLFSKEIMEKYAVLGMEAEIYKFFQKFRSYIDLNMDKTDVGADLDAIRFILDNRAGTNNKKSIISRFNYIVSKFLEWYSDVEMKDEQREFNEKKRIAIYRKDNGKCQNPDCSLNVPYDQFHADHVIPHSQGGPTIVSNGQVLCVRCNEKKQNNMDIGY